MGYELVEPHADHGRVAAAGCVLLAAPHTPSHEPRRCHRNKCRNGSRWTPAVAGSCSGSVSGSGARQIK